LEEFAVQLVQVVRSLSLLQFMGNILMLLPDAWMTAMPHFQGGEEAEEEEEEEEAIIGGRVSSNSCDSLPDEKTLKRRRIQQEKMQMLMQTVQETIAASPLFNGSLEHEESPCDI
jgi:hypothetical protein